MYLVFGKNERGELEWNGVHTPEQAATFIKVHYKEVLERCDYDWRLIHKEILVLKVPTYNFVAVIAEPPTETKVILGE